MFPNSIQTKASQPFSNNKQIDLTLALTPFTRDFIDSMSRQLISRGCGSLRAPHAMIDTSAESESEFSFEFEDENIVVSREDDGSFSFRVECHLADHPHHKFVTERIPLSELVSGYIPN